MKGILIAQKPRDCENIVSGEKTIIVCKRMPKLQTPFKGYIFCTKGNPFIQKIRFGDIAISHTQISKILYNGRVIGEFICDRVAELDYVCYWNNGYEIATCMTYREVANYGKGKTLYGLHITDLKIYDKPKELSEFKRPCSYKGLCFSCKRAHFYGDGSFVCTNKVTRPSQSWCYVQELEEMG